MSPTIFREATLIGTGLGTIRVWLDSHGKTHRKLGPAVEYSSGQKSWFNHGWHITSETGFASREGGMLLPKGDRIQ